MVLEEAGPATASTVPVPVQNRVAGSGEDRADLVQPLVGASVSDVHHGVFGEEGHDSVEPAAVTQGVVGGHEATDLLSGVQLPGLHRTPSGSVQTTSVPDRA